MKNYKNILVLVLATVIVILAVFRCNPNNEIKPIQEKAKVVEKSRNVYIDSFKNKRIELAKSNEILLKSINVLKKENERLKSKKIVVPNDVNGLVNFFNERYKTNENKVVENKVGLVEETAYDVSFELSEFDRQLQVLENQNKIIVAQDSLNENLKTEIKGFEKAIYLYSNEVSEKDKLNLMFEKENKKLKRKNTFNKVLIPTVFVLGSFLGYTIAK